MKFNCNKLKKNPVPLNESIQFNFTKPNGSLYTMGFSTVKFCILSRVHTCFVCILEQKAIISLYDMDCLL